jgi:hypothetical protein
MTRTVFVLFLVSILLLFVLLVTSMIDNNSLVDKVQSQTILIDSLQTECTIKDITIGRDEFILEQLEEKHPQDIKKLYNETE